MRNDAGADFPLAMRCIYGGKGSPPTPPMQDKH